MLECLENIPRSLALKWDDSQLCPYALCIKPRTVDTRTQQINQLRQGPAAGVLGSVCATLFKQLLHSQLKQSGLSLSMVVAPYASTASLPTH